MTIWADIQATLVELWSNAQIRSSILIAAAVLGAYLVELIFRRVFMALASKTKTDLDDKIVKALQRPIFWSGIFIGIAIATDALLKEHTFIVFAVLKTLAVVAWALAAVKVAEVVLMSIAKRGRSDSLIQMRTLPVFDMMSKVMVVGAAFYFVFLSWKINVSAWIASAGIVGIAVGFAAKDTLANLFAGIFLLADNIYKVGDFIVLNNDPRLRGRVTRIGVRSTRILTMDDVEVTVPNALIGSSTVINEVGGPSPHQRVHVTVSVAYGTEVEPIFTLLTKCAEGIPEVSEYPVPRARLMAFGASGLELELLVWIHEPADRELAISLLNIRIYNALRAAGIEIPYSKHDLYLKELPDRARAKNLHGAPPASGDEPKE